jgi:hypothetical protein
MILNYRYEYASEKKINTTERLGCLVYKATRYHRTVLSNLVILTLNQR